MQPCERGPLCMRMVGICTQAPSVLAHPPTLPEAHAPYMHQPQASYTTPRLHFTCMPGSNLHVQLDDVTLGTPLAHWE